MQSQRTQSDSAAININFVSTPVKFYRNYSVDGKRNKDFALEWCELTPPRCSDYVR